MKTAANASPTFERAARQKHQQVQRAAMKAVGNLEKIAANAGVSSSAKSRATVCSRGPLKL